MSIDTWRKYLKIVSIVCIVAYSALTVLGILIITPLIDSQDFLQAMGIERMLTPTEGSIFVAIAGAVIAVVYAIQLLAAIAVLRGAKNPSKMKLGMISYGIITAFQVFSLITSLNAGGGSIGMPLVQLIVSASISVGCIEVYRSSKQPLADTPLVK